MTPVVPDLAGFAEAQARGRELLGESITLLGPVVATYAPGVKLDPETGAPFDPLIDPVASARASALVKGKVTFRAVMRGGLKGSIDTPVGRFDRGDVMLILNSGAASAASGKEQFVARQQVFDISGSKFDGVTGIDRFIVYGSTRKDA